MNGNNWASWKNIKRNTKKGKERKNKRIIRGNRKSTGSSDTHKEKKDYINKKKQRKRIIVSEKWIRM